MNAASPPDVTRLLHTWGRGEKTVLGEHIPQVHGDSCRQVPHPIGREPRGPTPRTAVSARAP
jgi:hypothetical protein